MSLRPTGEAEHFVEMSKVVELFAKNVKPAQIARETGIKLKDVKNYIVEWKETAVGSELMMERMEELLASMDEHYSVLISKFHEIVDEVDEDLAGESKSRPAYLAQ